MASEAILIEIGLLLNSPQRSTLDQMAEPVLMLVNLYCVIGGDTKGIANLAGFGGKRNIEAI
ncbi:hypothetical protein [Methylomonas sp. MgM2]